MPSEGLYYPPTLITNVQPVSTVVQEEIFGLYIFFLFRFCVFLLLVGFRV
jgi:hypothetical protein